MNVFDEPVCLGCMHTFCTSCIADWIKRNIDKNEKPECPFCKTQIRPEHITKDLLAYNIVQELKVFCPHKKTGCQWQGEIEQVLGHQNNNCRFKNGNEEKPDWLNTDIN